MIMLQKLHGRTVDALYCSRCGMFSIIKINEATTIACPACKERREKCTITIHEWKTLPKDRTLYPVIKSITGAVLSKPSCFGSCSTTCPNPLACHCKPECAKKERERQARGNHFLSLDNVCKEPNSDCGYCHHSIDDCLADLNRKRKEQKQSSTITKAATDERSEFIDHSLELAKDAWQERDKAPTFVYPIYDKQGDIIWTGELEPPSCFGHYPAPTKQICDEDCAHADECQIETPAKEGEF